MPWEISVSEGKEYYFNTETGDITWECPQELLDSDTDYIWVRHEEDVFVPCKVVEMQDDENILVELEGGQTMLVSSTGILECIPSMSSLLRLPTNLVEIDVINEPSVLYTLRKRFNRDEIYTYLGDILVIVNPFKRIPTPSYQVYMDAFRSRDDVFAKLPPHPFAVAADAFSKLLYNHKDQTILIGGESGAGKTETTKTCLRFLSLVASSTLESDVEAEIMSANPILEAFGNAKTIRNDNSSRFGKFMELTYDSCGHILRCSTTNYLLEKCRVHRQSTGERSFHVFYQLCCAAEYASRALAGPDSMSQACIGCYGSKVSESNYTMPECIQYQSVLDDKYFLASLRMQTADQFDYLSQSGCFNVTDLDDIASFVETEKAANTLGFSPEIVRKLFMLCAAVLHLGNIAFVDTTSPDGLEFAEICDNEKSTAALQAASLLLCLDEERLTQGLSSREISIRGERTKVRLTARQSAESRDALSKSLYSNCFDWIVGHVNPTFAAPPVATGRRAGAVRGSEENFIGILDIFGFEIFDDNSLEQLCINYANEKLQQFFNRNVFKTEEQLYRDEGIPFDNFVFVDNQDVLDLIEEKQMGILSIIDDEVNIPRATDLTLLRKLYQAYLPVGGGAGGDSARSSINKRKPVGGEVASVQCAKRFLPASSAANDSFVIDHYAGRVEYRIEDFLDSSRDRISDDIQNLLKDCIFEDMVTQREDPVKGDGSRGASRVQTLGRKFKIQLETLMSTLSATEPHYIKCIKPNSLKVPNCFQGTTCFHQLKASGIFEAVEIKSKGFNVRHSHSEFILQYGVLGGVRGLGKSPNLSARCETVLKGIATKLGRTVSELGVYIGKTRVFSMYEQHKVLARMLSDLRLFALRTIQRIARGVVARLRFNDYKKLVTLAAAALKMSDDKTSLSRVETALSSLQRFQYRYFWLLSEKKCRIVHRIKVEEELEKLQHKSIAEIDGQWMDTVLKARQMGITGDIADKVFGLLQKAEMKITCDKRLRRLVSEGCSETAQLESAIADIERLKPILGSDFCKEDELLICQMLHAAVEGRPIDLSMHQQRHRNYKEVTFRPETLPVLAVESATLELGCVAICELCKEKYERPPKDKAPRMLHCLHTFCQQCLMLTYDSMQGGVKCPACSECTKCSAHGVEGLKLNYAILTTLPPLCDNCENTHATFKCLHCPADCTRLCRACADQHQRVKAFRNHSIVGVDVGESLSSEMMCPLHPTKLLNTYCLTCRCVICLTCGVFDHASHDVAPVDVAVSRERELLAHNLQDTRADVTALRRMETELNSTLPSLAHQKQIMREVTTVVFSGLKKLVKSRHADLLSSLEVLYSSKRKELVGHFDQLSFQIDCLQSAASTSSQIIEEGDDVRVLEILPTVQRHLNTLKIAPLKFNRAAIDADLAFTAGPEQEVRRLIDSVGLSRGTAACADAFKCSVELIQSGVFTGSWRVMLLLVTRNMRGDRLEGGGLPVVFEVSETKQSPYMDSVQFEAPNLYEQPLTSSEKYSPDEGTRSIGRALPSYSLSEESPSKGASLTVGGKAGGGPVLSTGGRRITNYTPLELRNKVSKDIAKNDSIAGGPLEKRQRAMPTVAAHSPFITSIADNNDGTYFLLVSPRGGVSKRDEVTITVKIFGQHVAGSPMRLDLESLLGRQHDLSRDKLGHSPDQISLSPSQDDISVLSSGSTSIESFFKYITGGLL